MRHLAAFLLSCLILAPACGPAAAGGSFYDAATSGPGLDPTAVHVDEAGEIAAVAACTVASADPLLVEDASAGNAKCQTSAGAIAALATGAGIDTTAVHDNVAGEIHAVAAVTAATGDKLLVEDASNAWAKGSITIQGILDLVTAGVVHDSDTYANCVASTPTAEGDECHPTDSPYTLLSRDGSTWVHRYPGIGFDVTPPPSASWTARNSASVAAAGGVRTMTLAAGSGVSYEMETRAVPATPYYVEMAFALASYANGEYGSMFFQTSNSKFVIVAYNEAGINHQDYTNYTTWAAHNAQVTDSGSDVFILRLVDDGVNRKAYAVNPATQALVQIGANDARTNHITADHIGWGGYPNEADMGASLALVHWSTGTP